MLEYRNFQFITNSQRALKFAIIAVNIDERVKMNNPELYMTDNAAAKVFELIEEEGNFDLKLRVYVTGGGCSGFQYGFSFDEAVNEDDLLIEKAMPHQAQKVYLVVDPMSLSYLIGAEIDYEDGIEGAQFIIRNPNAKTTCGCGSSFSA